MLRDCKKKTVIDRILKVDEQEAIYRVSKEILQLIEEKGSIH